MSAAAVQGRRGLGPRAGAYASRLGRGTAGGGEFRRGKLCADYDGFSLHGGVRVPGYCRERLEKLCRYAARPPVVHERMSLSADGKKVLYRLKRRYRDGSTHVVLDPLELIERLAALVPRPRVNLTTYHGILAPAASYRDRVVPGWQEEPEGEESEAAGCAPEDPRGGEPAECGHCGGRRQLLQFLTDPAVIGRILRHLGLPTDAPRVAPARGPPEPLLPWL